MNKVIFKRWESDNMRVGLPVSGFGRGGEYVHLMAQQLQLAAEGVDRISYPVFAGEIGFCEKADTH